MGFNPPEVSALLERCRAGQEEAWPELLRHFDEMVTKWIARLNPFLNAEDVQDMRQEVLGKAAHKFNNYDASKASFKSWLFQLTHSKSVDHIRKTTAESNRPAQGFVHLDASTAEGEEEKPQVQLASLDKRPDEAAACNDEFRSMFSALNQLGDPDCRCRQLIELRYFGEFAYEEIAEILTINAGTVSSALSRCLKDLRDIFFKLFRE